LEDPDRDPIEALVISRTVKEENRYVNPNSMSNVIAARKLEEMGEEFMPGMKVSWIVTDAKKSPMEVEPYVSGRPFEKRPDWEYYARRVAQTLSYITEAYGWDEKALFTGTQPAQQKSLFSEDFNGEAPPPDGDRRTEKKLTLEDFF
jgi:DNA polymerase I